MGGWRFLQRRCRQKEKAETISKWRYFPLLNWFSSLSNRKANRLSTGSCSPKARGSPSRARWPYPPTVKSRGLRSTRQPRRTSWGPFSTSSIRMTLTTSPSRITNTLPTSKSPTTKARSPSASKRRCSLRLPTFSQTSQSPPSALVSLSPPPTPSTRSGNLVTSRALQRPMEIQMEQTMGTVRSGIPL